MKNNGKKFGLFQLIDQKRFRELVDKWEMDKWVREFKTWEMTCALISCMTMRLGSYREVEEALGIPRSTFGDAMTERSHGFFEALCDEILFSIRAKTEDRKVKRAIRQLLVIDSSEIPVHGSLFSAHDWKSKTSRADNRLASAKLHLVWNIDGQWVNDFMITGVRRHDSPVSRLFSLEADKTYVFDRAYNDFRFWLEIIKTGSHFVTRLKKQSFARFKDAQRAEAKNRNRDGVLYDGIYEPNLGLLRKSKVPPKLRLGFKLRCVVYRDQETKKVFYFVTSDFESTAQMIADIYKKRWAVELLFRWLKSHLDIRRLTARNKNAVKIQLATAVLIQLLLQLKKTIERYKGTLWELLRSIRTSLIAKSLSGMRAPSRCRWKSATRANLTAAFL